MLKSQYPNQTVKSQHVSINISSSENWIEFLFASLKPVRRACPLAYDNPYLRWNLIFDQKGSGDFFHGDTPEAKI